MEGGRDKPENEEDKGRNAKQAGGGGREDNGGEGKQFDTLTRRSDDKLSSFSLLRSRLAGPRPSPLPPFSLQPQEVDEPSSSARWRSSGDQSASYGSDQPDQQLLVRLPARTSSSFRPPCFPPPHPTPSSILWCCLLPPSSFLLPPRFHRHTQTPPTLPLQPLPLPSIALGGLS